MEHKCKKTDLKTVEKCELNAEQIKKALECCVDGDCYPCPYAEIGAGCRDRMAEDALALITSQEQRIKELAEENERLSQSLANSKSILANSKADTVREMQSEIKERCIKGGIYPTFVARTVDQIAKEIIGGAKQ